MGDSLEGVRSSRAAHLLLPLGSPIGSGSKRTMAVSLNPALKYSSYSTYPRKSYALLVSRQIQVTSRKVHTSLMLPMARILPTSTLVPITFIRI